MTDEQIQKQIEVLEEVGRKLRNSPELAREFIADLEKRVGFPLEDKKTKMTKSKKKR